MVQAKMMNESAFEKLTKEFGALGELIRTRQDEKQAVLNEFDKERERYKTGKISENTLASSVKKTNLELIKLDKAIREIIQKSVSLAGRMNVFLRNQQPKVFRAKESGIFLQGGAKKKTMKKKKSIKKVKISKTEVVQEMKAEKKLLK
jgi:hypothetical protein